MNQAVDNELGRPMLIPTEAYVSEAYARSENGGAEPSGWQRPRSCSLSALQSPALGRCRPSRRSSPQPQPQSARGVTRQSKGSATIVRAGALLAAAHGCPEPSRTRLAERNRRQRVLSRAEGSISRSRRRNERSRPPGHPRPERAEAGSCGPSLPERRAGRLCFRAARSPSFCASKTAWRIGHMVTGLEANKPATHLFSPSLLGLVCL